MKPPINKEKIRFYLRVGFAFWGLWMFSDFTSGAEHLFPERFFNNIWRTMYVIALNFLLFEYTIPSIKVTWKRLLMIPFLILGYLFLLSFGFRIWRSIGAGLKIYTFLKTFPSLEKEIENQMPVGVFSIFFFGIIRHFYNYRKLKETAQKLQIEKQRAELNYLKSQTNPHFLFNTLNNIYSLSRDNSDLAPESILRLSKILRFMLYEISGNFIAIEQELKIMGDYIELEKLRYDDSLFINFSHDIEDPKQAVPPLLLIPLVENAFKHGASETRHNPFIHIHLLVKNRQLTFSIKNSIESYSGDRSIKENIGLTNLRRQLELLYSEFDLSVQKTETEFTSILKINLASHV